MTTRALDVKIRSRPKFDDLHHLLKEGNLAEFVSKRDERVAQWKEERYRICLDCGKKKLRIMFDGESKYCKRCVTTSKRGAKKRRREYQKEYARGPGSKLWSAKQVVYHLKKMGILKQQPCEKCGSEKSQAHHKDYNRPWEVMWLCGLHHREWHKENTPIYVH